MDGRTMMFGVMVRRGKRRFRRSRLGGMIHWRKKLIVGFLGVESLLDGRIRMVLSRQIRRWRRSSRSRLSSMERCMEVQRG
jgi:hypothetical protein